ncbi:TPA: hypothetical protein N0F65_000693 [Lagenidium giganteum]|uniref:FAD-binding domain-containing protein n=1 Tax=Lagenidium giganteum TaxID=4803 RepID=A0AAV2YYI9_9STRA|nr:TPA: hypothetical protein N0F65_000693 [Lagenidium giganteum]
MASPLASPTAAAVVEPEQQQQQQPTAATATPAPAAQQPEPQPEMAQPETPAAATDDQQEQQPSSPNWNSLAQHYEKVLLEDTQRDPAETSCSSSEDGGGSPRAHEISVPLDGAPNGGLSKSQHAEVAARLSDLGDPMRKSSMDRRITYIGEGLLDIGAMDAMDRLSEMSIDMADDAEAARRMPPPTHEPTIVDNEDADSASSGGSTQDSEAPSVDAPAAIDAPTEEAPASAPAPAPAAPPATENKLQSFLAHNHAPASSEVTLQTPAPSAPRDNLQKRRSKLLDFLANDANDRYLDDVYQDEQRDEQDDDDEADVPPQNAEKVRHRRTNRANSKLLAFLSKVEGEKTYSGEHGDGADRDSDNLRKRQEATKIYDATTQKPTAERPRFVIFNPEDVKHDALPGSETGASKLHAFLAKEEPHLQYVNNQIEHELPTMSKEDTRNKLHEFLAHEEPTKAVTPEPTANESNQTQHDAPTPTPAPTSAPARTGSRLTSFFSRSLSKNNNQPKETSAPAPQPAAPPAPAPAPAPAPVADVAASEATPVAVEPVPEPESTGPRKPSQRMLELMSKLNNIKLACEQNELTEVATAKISSLLASISQVVAQDLSRERPTHSMEHLRRRLSTVTAPEPSKVSWVKTAKEREIEEKLHTITIASQPLSFISETAPTVPELAPVKQLALDIAPTVGESFKAFEAAQNLMEVLSTYHTLLIDCGLSKVKLEDPWAVYHHIKIAVHDKLGFRQKQLFKLLDMRINTDVYRKKPSAGQRVCIIGAGPVGLRAAVEMALLGACVVVIEKRKHFSRENILHLWPWVVQDLTSLGAKVLFPQFCHSTAYFHVGTRQLQCILLKVALLLGATVFPVTAYESIARPDAIASDRKPFYTLVTKPQIPWMEFTAVLGASGTQDTFSKDAGLERFVFSRKEAIGIVCYFPNHGTPEEKRVSEFSWTIQFKQDMFAKMRAIGLDLENIVYYRGEMHYIVMTPKRQNLLDEGVVRTNYLGLRELLADDNVNVGNLHDYVTRALRFFKIPQKAPFARVRMFDFSTRTRANKAANVLSSKGKKLYCGLIGDSLMEPFWPEGLGTCRGFLGALDGCWMVSQIGKQGDEQLLADRELGYRIIQHVSGFSRDDLQKNVRKYNCDPRSRYTVRYPAPLPLAN